MDFVSIKSTKKKIPCVYTTINFLLKAPLTKKQEAPTNKMGNTMVAKACRCILNRKGFNSSADCQGICSPSTNPKNKPPKMNSNTAKEPKKMPKQVFPFLHRAHKQERFHFILEISKHRCSHYHRDNDHEEPRDCPH